MGKTVIYAVGRKLALDVVAGAAGTVALRAAALDHKAADDTVEDQSVIELAVGQRDKVLYGFGCDFGIQLQFDDAAILHGNGCNGIFAVHGFLLSFVFFTGCAAHRAQQYQAQGYAKQPFHWQTPFFRILKREPGTLPLLPLRIRFSPPTPRRHHQRWDRPAWFRCPACKRQKAYTGSCR